MPITRSAAKKAKKTPYLGRAIVLASFQIPIRRHIVSRLVFLYAPDRLGHTAVILPWRNFVKCIALALVLALAVTAPAQNLSFEVASVKLNESRPQGGATPALGCHGTDSHNPNTTIPMGRCVVRYESLRYVIALAYNIPPAMLNAYEGKVLSGPDWVRSEVYNIDAKAEMPTTEAQLKLMLQALLAERFKLKVHHETREMPVFTLVTAKNGLKLQPAPKDRDCAGQNRSDHRYELGERNIAGACRAFIPGDGGINGISVNMSDFAEFLANWAGRAVIDKTGSDGLFDFKMPRVSSANALNVNPNATGRGGGPPAPPGAEGRFSPDSLPTVFTAIEQFGLKLESSKGPVDVLVIDEIQKPTDN
jgi:uncharacterized protein (TIGR03435 family)